VDLSLAASAWWKCKQSVDQIAQRYLNLSKTKENYRYSGAAVASPPQERFDVWRVVDDYYGQTVGKLQAESMMSTAARLFP
jgi:hypothetical protein